MQVFHLSTKQIYPCRIRCVVIIYVMIFNYRDSTCSSRSYVVTCLFIDYLSEFVKYLSTIMHVNIIVEIVAPCPNGISICKGQGTVTKIGTTIFLSRNPFITT